MLISGGQLRFYGWIVQVDQEHFYSRVAVEVRLKFYMLSEKKTQCGCQSKSERERERQTDRVKVKGCF